jgi:NAD(P)H-hydrate epimerase
MKIVTAEEMRAIDRATTERFGVPSLTLMENAGTAVADFVLERHPQATRITAVCGKGNNGGDGFVAARKLLAAGKSVQVVLLADPAEVKGDAATMLARLPLSPVLARNSEEYHSEAARRALECDVLVDAILGTGFRPPVTGFYAEAICEIGRLWHTGAFQSVAVDIPSGADSDVFSSAPPDEGTLYVPADGIVTFTAPKPRHVFDAYLTRGSIVVAPIGSPPEAVVSKLNLEVTTADDLRPFLAPRDPEAHKGRFGHVLVIGGSVGKAGAAAMAGMAALRMGSGLATVATPKSVLPTVAGFQLEVMTEPLAETDSGTISLRALEYGLVDAILERKEVLGLGPGISRHPESAEFVRTLVASCAAPVVLDADGLNAFEGSADRLRNHKNTLVLTPHPGEMSRLAVISTREVEQDRIAVARRFARDHNVILVLKGHRTLTAVPDGRIWVNPTGNPGMATGGVGDILTGMIAGALAQAVNDRSTPGETKLLQAVVAAVYLHGLGGDAARDEMGEPCMLATDILRYLPQAFARARRRAAAKYTILSE